MRKFRIKVEEKGEGNLYTPQVSADGFWPLRGWRGFEYHTEIGYSYDITFDNIKEAQEFIQERKSKETTKTYYL